HLVANSFYITLSNASMGLLGFLFWIVATRLYHTSQVGIATTLVSAAIFIASASQLGFNVSFVRFLPASEHRSDDIDTGLSLIFLCAILIGGIYMAVVPATVPQLRFLYSNWPQAVAIVLYVAFGAVNVSTDSVFIAFRQAQYNVLVDGLLQGTIRLVAPIALVSLGAFGLMTAYGVASLAAIVASVFLMMWRYDYRPRFRIHRHALRTVLHFGVWSYLAELCTMAPLLVLPLVVLHERDASSAAYYYLALAVAQLLFTAGMAVGQSVLAEGANQAASFQQLGRRAAKLQLVIAGAAVILILGAHRILEVFGRAYASHATLTLVVLLASAPAVGVRYGCVSLLRLRHELASVMAANLCLVVVPTVIAVFTIHNGLVWAAIGWLIGNIVSVVIAVLALWRSLRRQPADAAGLSVAGSAQGGLEAVPGRLGGAGAVGEPEEVLVGRQGSPGVAG
ncbi:MAG TPA: oligosaccharide flippase family protein, partial [Acidimicrobiales bacterium]|nr:oligosaccharide flippase family protein [Acidimicrobiales bacterium]